MATNSILDSTKLSLGVEVDDHSFDVEILMHINSALATLQQIGIGPEQGFEIEDQGPTWIDFIGAERPLNSVKAYVCLKVRTLFDPPSTSFHMDAMKSQITELEWRLNVQREGVVHPWTPRTT